MSLESSGEREAEPPPKGLESPDGKASLTALESGKPPAGDQQMHFKLKMLHQMRWRRSGIIAMIACVATTLLPLRLSTAQEFLPSPPSDRALIYTLDEQNNLVSLPFEQGQTPLRPEQVAKSTRVSYLELKGEHAATIFKTAMPRLFLFTYQRPGAHPPFLVWLTPHKGARRVTAIAQRGMSGYAISSEEIIKPTIRGLVKDGELVFMEVRPRVSLMPGEYAIIGDDLARIATFRVVAAGN